LRIDEPHDVKRLFERIYQHKTKGNRKQSIQYRNYGVCFEKLERGNVATEIQNSGQQNLVQREEQKHFHLQLAVAGGKRRNESECEVKQAEKKLQHYQVQKIFTRAFVIARDSAVIKIINAEIKQDGKEKGIIEDGKVSSVNLGAEVVLNHTVYSENPKRFNQKVGGKKKNKVSGKLSAHQELQRLKVILLLKAFCEPANKSSRQYPLPDKK
jgi:hypothetical protein